VHGWQENANAFDPIMNLLPADLSVLAVDMPGNGLSSHYASRTPYHLMEDVGAMRALLQHFKFPDPVSFLLHSYSMGMGFTYASAYPQVQKIANGKN
jgi:pimeloyl-ACP methyl ester carboxylesterase